MENTVLKEGQLVTVHFDLEDSFSNVYIVVKDVGDSCFLKHPLYPHFYVIVSKDRFEKDVARTKDPMEKCIDLIFMNKSMVDYIPYADLESICAFLIIKRYLTSKQRRVISSLCGRIANIKNQGDMLKTAKFVIQNKALLDSFNIMFYKQIENVLKGKQIPTPDQKELIFKLAGFILAQLEVDKVTLASPKKDKQ